MIYPTVLALHLTAAALTGLVIVFALYTLVLKNSALYRVCALALGGIATFEVMSGTVLAVLSPDLSAAALSLHIFEYLGVCLLVESVLYARMKKVSLAFPVGFTLSPVLASIVLFVAAISYGF